MIRFQTLIAVLLMLAALYCMPHRVDAATSCTTSTTSLAFGTVTGASNVDSTAVVTIQCSSSGLLTAGTVRVRMCLNIGAGASGDGQTNPRRMTNSFGDVLPFQIYRDSARSQIWGFTGNSATPTPLQLDLEYGALVVGSGSTQAVMYGRVFPGAGLAAGSYTNSFITIADTRLDYRVSEPIALLPNPYPTSCTSGGSDGGSVTFPFTASATVPNNCTISTATNLDFGTVPGRIDADRDQTSALTFTCTGRTAWNVALNNGQNAVGNVRRMRLGTSNNYVTYELYRNAARTQRWGAAIGTDTVPGTGTGTAQTLTVFGRAPATQVVPAGNYRDVITVTVTY